MVKHLVDLLKQPTVIAIATIEDDKLLIFEVDSFRQELYLFVKVL